MLVHLLIRGAFLITVLFILYLIVKAVLDKVPETVEEKQSRIDQLRKIQRENEMKIAELEASKKILQEAKTSKKLNEQQVELDDKIKSI